MFEKKNHKIRVIFFCRAVVISNYLQKINALEIEIYTDRLIKRSGKCMGDKVSCDKKKKKQITPIWNFV